MDVLMDSLKRFGLSEKEGKVYLSCLELGESTANDIAIKSHLPRTLIYDIMKRLGDKSLASTITKEKTKYFTVVNPEKLLSILKEKENSISSVLSDLKTLQKSNTKIPKAEVFLGIDGVKSAVEAILHSNPKEIYTYGSSATGMEMMPSYIFKWHLRRIKLGIHSKQIFNDVTTAKLRIKKYPETLKCMEYKFLPIKHQSPSVFIIYNNKMLMIYWGKEPVTILIESEEIVENHLQHFHQLWKIAKTSRTKKTK